MKNGNQLDRVKMCIIGDCNDDADSAHLITQATIPKDMRDWRVFIIDLCRRHHTEQHQIGIDSFCSKYGLTWRLEEAREALKLSLPRS